MSEEATIALVAIGVAVVAFFVVTKTSATPGATARNVAPSNTATAFLNGIVTLANTAATSIRTTPNANAPLAGISGPGGTDYGGAYQPGSVYTSQADAIQIPSGSD